MENIRAKLLRQGSKDSGLGELSKDKSRENAKDQPLGEQKQWARTMWQTCTSRLNMFGSLNYRPDFRKGSSVARCDMRNQQKNLGRKSSNTVKHPSFTADEADSRLSHNKDIHPWKEQNLPAASKAAETLNSHTGISERPLLIAKETKENTAMTQQSNKCAKGSSFKSVAEQLIHKQMNQKVKAPDIFVTSHTGSGRYQEKKNNNSDISDKCSSSCTKIRRGSLDKIASNGLTLKSAHVKLDSHSRSSPSLNVGSSSKEKVNTGNTKQSLVKSYSDSQCNKQDSQHYEYLHFLTDDASKRIKSKPRYFEIDCGLYIGSIELAYSEPLLCKLKISSVVDVSGLDPGQVSTSKKCMIPCLCTSSTSHKPAILRMSLDQHCSQSLKQSFKTINKFVHASLDHGKKVAIVCYNGNNLSAATAIQYHLQNHHLGLNSLLMKISQKNKDVSLSDDMLIFLKAENERLRPRHIETDTYEKKPEKDEVKGNALPQHTTGKMVVGITLPFREDDHVDAQQKDEVKDNVLVNDVEDKPSHNNNQGTKQGIQGTSDAITGQQMANGQVYRNSIKKKEKNKTGIRGEISEKERNSDSVVAVAVDFKDKEQPAIVTGKIGLPETEDIPDVEVISVVKESCAPKNSVLRVRQAWGETCN